MKCYNYLYFLSGVVTGVIFSFLSLIAINTSQLDTLNYSPEKQNFVVHYTNQTESTLVFCTLNEEIKTELQAFGDVTENTMPDCYWLLVSPLYDFDDLVFYLETTYEE